MAYHGTGVFDRLAASWGAARDAWANADRASGNTRPPMESQAEPQPYGRRHARSIATSVRGLTPGRIATLLREADDGQPQRMFELLEEVEDRDLHLVSVLGTRKRSVANLDWCLEPASEKRRDLRVAEQCEELVRRIDNLEDGLLDLLDAVSKGVAFAELDWKSEQGGVWVSQLLYRPQRWFQPAPDDPLCWRVVSDAHSDGEELVPDRWLVHQSRAKSGFPVKAGLGRVLTWWYLFKNYAVKDWVSYGELFGAPLRVGKFPMGAQPKDIDALETALRQLGVDAAAVIPTDMEVEFIGDSASRAGPEVYASLVRLAESGMSKAVLGQTLTTDEGQHGTRAQAQVHDEVRQDIRDSDAKQLARTLKRDLLEPLVRFNFGPEAAVPNWAFDLEESEDESAVVARQKDRAAVFIHAISMGVPVAVDQVREELELREPAEGEMVLERLSPSVPSEGSDPASDGDSEPLAGRAGVFRVTLRANTPVPFANRPLPPHLAQVEGLVEQYRAGTVGAWEDLVRSVQDVLLAETSIPGALAAFDELVRRLDLQALATPLQTATWSADLVGMVQAASGDGGSPVRGIPLVPPQEAMDFWVQKQVVTPGQFYRLGQEHRARAFTVARFTTLAGLQSVHTALEASLAQGQTLADFEDALEAAWSSEGLSLQAPWRIETVFRTNTMTAYAVGRDRQQRKPESLARRPLGRYRTMDDSRVRPEHLSLDGRLWPMDHPFWDVWSPPNGFGCRCWRTTHRVDEVEAEGWPVESDLPIDLGTGRPQLPDRGFERDPAKDPHTYDWSRFPKLWRDALGVEDTP